MKIAPFALLLAFFALSPAFACDRHGERIAELDEQIGALHAQADASETTSKDESVAHPTRQEAYRAMIRAREQMIQLGEERSNLILGDGDCFLQQMGDAKRQDVTVQFR
jgi:hypothetical protein